MKYTHCAPSSSALISNMSTAEHINCSHIADACAQFTCGSLLHRLHIQLLQESYCYQPLGSLFRLSTELKRKPKAYVQIGWWLDSKPPKEGNCKGTVQGWPYSMLPISVIASTEQKCFLTPILYRRKTKMTNLPHNEGPATPSLIK